jgi:hypothetical protein
LSHALKSFCGSAHGGIAKSKVAPQSAPAGPG